MPFAVSSVSNDAPQRIYIALGANQSYRRTSPIENLKGALHLLTARGVQVKACSKPWCTPAWPNPKDPPFVNAVARVETGLSPENLMQTMHLVENELGRIRTIPNAPRTIDLDLIDYHGVIVQSKSSRGLQLPHPRATGRAFVMLPLRDITTQWRDPVSGQSVLQHLSHIPWADRKACRPAGGVLWAAR